MVFKGSPLDGPFLDKSYDEAMELVHAVAAYLDGEGKTARDGLDEALRPVFTSESLRLTTRLMQVVAWLMVHRAVAAGELTPDEALTPARRLSGRDICLAPPLAGAERLPPQLKAHLDQSRQLYERIARLEERLLSPDQPANPVESLLNRLERNRP